MIVKDDHRVICLILSFSNMSFYVTKEADCPTWELLLPIHNMHEACPPERRRCFTAYIYARWSSSFTERHKAPWTEHTLQQNASVPWIQNNHSQSLMKADQYHLAIFRFFLQAFSVIDWYKGRRCVMPTLSAVQSPERILWLMATSKHWELSHLCTALAALTVITFKRVCEYVCVYVCVMK